MRETNQIDEAEPIEEPPSVPQRPATLEYASIRVSNTAPLFLDWLLGFTALLICVYLGDEARRLSRLPLPGPVIGLALFAILLELSNLFRMERHAARVEPAARLLISHMGLLFVPAGAGIMVVWPIIHAQWPAIVAGLVGSTFIGLISTAWLMHLHLLDDDDKD
jgi:putative effector of murein hydrolase LrgA (UPF0299 family)